MAIKFLNSVNADSGVLYVDAANDRVGIGTASPETLLQLNGAVYSMIGMYSDHTYSSNRNWRIVTNSFGAGNWGGLAIKTSDTAGGTPNTTRFGIDYLGNVGIGTTSPSQKLHVAGNVIIENSSGAELNLKNTSSGSQWQVVSGYNGGFEIGDVTNSLTDASAVFFITSSTGRVGIGTTAPAYKLDVNGTARVSDLYVSGNIIHDGDTNNRIIFGTDTQTFRTAGTDRLHITSAGNVGIGTTSPVENLEVYDASANAWIVVETGLNNAGTQYINTTSAWTVGIKANDSDSFYIGNQEGLSAGYFILDTSGNLQLTAYGAGYLKSDANGNITVDSDTIEDTLDSVTTRGNTTTNNITVGNFTANGNITTNTGIFYSGNSTKLDLNQYNAGYLRLLTDNTERVRVTATGNVGIGTTSPQRELHIKGDTWAEMRLEGRTFASGHGASLEFYSEGTALADIYASTDKHLYFRTNGSTERMRITSAGNVGIGTTSPTRTLHVDGTVRFVNSGFAGFEAHNTNGTWESFIGTETGGGGNRYNSASSQHTFYNNSTAVMRINSSGNVGIGTTSPSDKLVVAGVIKSIGGTNDGKYAQIYVNDSYAYYTTNAGVIYMSTELQVNSGKIGSYDEDLSLETSGTTRITVSNTTGNVGIGTTSPTRTLHVAGTGRFTGNLYSTSTDVDGIKTRFLSGAANNSTNNGTLYLQYGKSNPVSIGETGSSDLYVAGDVGIGTTSPNGKLNISASGAYTSLRLSTDVANELSFNHYSGYTTLRDNTLSNNRILFFDSGKTNIPGDLGIGLSGATQPSEKLHVSGNVRIEGDLTVNGSYTQIDTDVNTTEQWNVTNDGTGPAVTINQTGSQDIMDVQDDGTSVFYIEDGGNVGIGTTDPAANVDVKSDANPTIRITSGKDGTWTADEEIGSVEFYSSDGSGVGAGVRSAIRSLAYDNYGSRSELTFSTTGTAGDTENMRITSYGKLKLNQYGSNSFTGTAAYALAVDSSGNVIETTVQSSPAGIDGTGTVGYLTKWSTTDTITDSVIAESSGNIGVGIASPTSVLHIKDDTSTVYSATDYQKDFIIERKNTSGNNQSAHIRFLVTGYEGQTTGEASIGVVQTSNVSSGHIVFTNRHNGTRSETVRIQSDGKVLIGSTTTAFSDKLYINGDAYATGGWRVGSAATYVGKVTNGSGALTLESDGNRDIKFGSSTNGTKMYIDTSSGNVGIGTTSPAHDLHVDGDRLVFTQTGQTYTDGSSGLTGIGIRNTGTSSGYNAFGVQTGQGSVFQIRNNGAAIIGRGGTDSLDGYLVVNGGSGPSGEAYISLQRNSSQQFLLNTTATETQVRNTGNLPLYFYTNDSIRMAVAANGNVGIGTTSPSAKLDVRGYVTFQQPSGSQVTQFLDSTGDGLKITAWDNGANIDPAVANDNLYFGRDVTMSNFIVQSGNVGIGTTSPSQKLHVAGKGLFTDFVRFNGVTAPDFPVDIDAVDGGKSLRSTRGTSIFRIDQSNDGPGYIGMQSADDLSIQTNNTSKIYITSSGNVGIGTTSPSNKLDVRGLTRLNALSLRGGSDNYAHLSRFSWRDTNSSSSGSTWKKVCGVSVGAGNYSAVSVDVVHYYPGSNHGNSASLKKRYYSISFRRSSGTQDNQDDAIVYGRDANFIRVVRTALGEFELQARANVNNQSYSVDITQTGGNSDAITMVENSSTNGNTTGTIYTAVASANTTVELPGSLGVGSNVYLNHNGHSYLNGGNVGIGTTTPDAPLTVHSSTDPEIRFGYSSTQDHRIQWDSSKVYIHADPENANASSALGLYVDGNARLYIPDSGNVGIGTDNPGAKLTVKGADSINAFKVTDSGDGDGFKVTSHTTQGTYIQAYDASHTQTIMLDARTDNTNRHTYFNGGGNVGIGTTNPARELHIHSASNTQMQFTDDGTGSGSSDGLRVGWNGSVAQMYLFEDADIRFATNDSEKVRITSAGNVGIGTTNPTRKLHVVGGSTYAALLDSDQDYTLGLARSGTEEWWLKTYTDGRFAIHENGVGDKVTIKAGGNVGIGLNAPTTTLTVKGTSSNGIAVQGVNTTANRVFAGLDASNHGYLFVTGSSGQNPSLINSAGGNSYISGGNVGIGDTAPDAKLHVQTDGGSTTTPNTVLIIQANTATTTLAGGGTSLLFRGVSSGGNIQNYEQARIRSVGYATNNAHGFAIDVKPNASTSLTEALFLGSDGQLKLPYYGAGYLKTDASGNVTVDTSTIEDTLDSVTDRGNTTTNGIEVGALDVDGRFVVDSKTMTMTDSFSDALTVVMSNHTGCYVKITAFGDWGSHSSISYLGEFFLNNGAGSYNEPGMIIRQVDGTDSDAIQAQIVDPGGTTGNRDFTIQLKATDTASFTAYITYTIQGMFVSAS